MATEEPQNAPAASEGAPSARGPAQSFCFLVSSAAVMMRFEPAPPLSATPAQSSAFSKLCEPESVAGLALLEEMSPGPILANALATAGQVSEQRLYYLINFYNSQQPMDWAVNAEGPSGAPAALFPNWSASDWEGFGIAARELASEIEQAVESESFKSAAIEASALLGHAASPKRFHYPMLGLGVAESYATQGGKRVPTLSGFQLAEAGPAEQAQLAELGLEGIPSAAEIAERAKNEWEPVWEAIGSGGREQVNAAVGQIEPFALRMNKYIREMRNGPVPGAFEKFIAGAELDGGYRLSGENPLPSMRMIAEAARGNALRQAASNGSISPEPINQYEFGENGNIGSRAEVSNNRASRRAGFALGAWGGALCAALGERPLGSGSVAALHPGEPRLLELLGKPWESEPSARGGDHRRPYGYQSPAPDALTRAAQELHGLAARPGAQARGEEKLSPMHWARHLGSAARKVEPDKRPQAMRIIASALTPEMEALAQKFKQRGAKVGLAQAASQIWSVIEVGAQLRQVFQDEHGRTRFGLAHAEEGFTKTPGAHMIAKPGLDELMGSLRKARASFTQLTLAAAEEREALWLREIGWEGPWRQALSTGAVSAKALAWAAANPVGGALESSDPMERLAGASARALGLSGSESGAELASDYKEALAARGARPEGLELLGSSEGARNVFKGLARGMIGTDKELAQASSEALSFACVALGACAELGLGPQASGELLLSYTHGWRSIKGSFDGPGPMLGLVGVRDQETAEALRELGAAKLKKYPQFIKALVQDWSQTLAEAKALGLAEGEAGEMARGRVNLIRQALPTAPLFDWRQDWEGAPAWQLFGMSSPRFSAALRDATQRGGELGAWVAGRARGLGIVDARNGNDLIAQARDAIKSQTGMTDAAWKMATKSKEGLALLSNSFPLAGASASEFRGPVIEAGLRERLSVRQSAGGPPRERARELGLALTAAAGNGIDARDAAQVVGAFFDSPKGASLFGFNIESQLCSGGAGADFFCRESEAKRSRQPKIFIEACRRYQKLKADAGKPPVPQGEGGAPQEPGDPLVELGGEIQDLSDWVSGSEAGLWEQLPAEPTWGQLRRLSKSWHDEQALIAIEKASRQKAADAVAQAQFEAAAAGNPFMVRNSSRWAKLLGSFSHEGWEAVELLGSNELTEEGAAMHHCVSSYSPECREGSSRIFSLRLNGERVATLDLRGRKPLSEIDPQMQFSIVQNKGPYNQSVSAQCKAFAERTRAKVQEGWPAQCAAIQKKLDQRRAELAELSRDRRVSAKAAKL